MEHVSEACHSRIEVIVCATFPLGLVQSDSMKREFAARKGAVRWLGSGEGQSWIHATDSVVFHAEKGNPGGNGPADADQFLCQQCDKQFPVNPSGGPISAERKSGASLPRVRL